MTSLYLTSGRHPFRRGARVGARLLALTATVATLSAADCGRAKNTNDPTSACKYESDAAKDYLQFLQDYSKFPLGAKQDLTEMQTALVDAGHAVATNSGPLFDAIQAAQRAVDDALAALDAGKPVNTGALAGAMDNLGNLCSQGAGD